MDTQFITSEAAGCQTHRPGPSIDVDRRASPRFGAVEDRIWLGWWDGEQFQTVGAQLIDVSRTGAAIACVDGPEVGDAAWFCIVGPRLSGGARALVVGREPLPDDPDSDRLRLRFEHHCPDDLFEIALGLASSPGPEIFLN